MSDDATVDLLLSALDALPAEEREQVLRLLVRRGLTGPAAAPAPAWVALGAGAATTLPPGFAPPVGPPAAAPPAAGLSTAAGSSPAAAAAGPAAASGPAVAAQPAAARIAALLPLGGAAASAGVGGAASAGSQQQMVPVRFPVEQHAALRAWCGQNGYPMAAVVRGLVGRFLDEQSASA